MKNTNLVDLLPPLQVLRAHGGSVVQQHLADLNISRAAGRAITKMSGSLAPLPGLHFWLHR